MAIKPKATNQSKRTYVHFCIEHTFKLINLFINESLRTSLKQNNTIMFSVTRLGDFLNFLVTKVLSKEAQILCDF